MNFDSKNDSAVADLIQPKQAIRLLNESDFIW